MWNWWINVRKSEKNDWKLNTNNSENKKIEINLSNGWLHKFKKRNSFKRYRLHGESGDLNFEEIISELQKLRKKLSEYSINDVDEFDYFTNWLPIPALHYRDWQEGNWKRNGLLWWLVLMVTELKNYLRFYWEVKNAKML